MYEITLVDHIYDALHILAYKYMVRNWVLYTMFVLSSSSMQHRDLYRINAAEARIRITLCMYIQKLGRSLKAEQASV